MLSLRPPLGARIRSFAGIGDTWTRAVLGVMGRTVSNSQVGVPTLGPGNVTFFRIKLTGGGEGGPFPGKKRRLRQGHPEEEATGRAKAEIGARHPQAKGCEGGQETTKAGGGLGVHCPPNLQRGSAQPTLCLPEPCDSKSVAQAARVEVLCSGRPSKPAWPGVTCQMPPGPIRSSA